MYITIRLINGCSLWGHSGSFHLVVGFTTTYAISAYHHWCCEFESRSGRAVQHYVLKFVSDLRQVGGFLRVLRFPPPIKLTAMICITEILLKVALKTIAPHLNSLNTHIHKKTTMYSDANSRLWFGTKLCQC